MAAYGCVMIWFGQLFRKKSASLFVASGLVLMGVILEFLQGETSYRTFEFMDMAASAAGVALGFLLTRTRLGSLFSTIEAFMMGPSGPGSSKARRKFPA